jgi:hypothetical protein
MSEAIQTHAEVATIEARLARLERTGKAWRLAALGLVGAWALGLSCSRSDSGGPRVVAADQSAANGDSIVRKLRVNEIELVNLRGQTVGWINRGGEPSLSLLRPGEGNLPVQTFDVALRHPPTLTMRWGEGDAVLSPPFLRLSSESGLVSVKPGTVTVAGYGSGAWRKYQDVQKSLPVDADKRRFAEYMKQLDEAFSEASSVEICQGEGGGGMVQVRNTFGKPVVSIQANKANAGAVYVNDVNGETRNALTPR